MLGYLLEISSTSLEPALMGTCIAYIGKPYTMVAAFFIVAAYCGIKLKNWAKITLFAFPSMYPIILFTNKYHHLYYATIDYDPDIIAFSRLQLTRGPLYYSYMFLVFAFTIAAIVIIVREIKRSTTKVEKEQCAWMLAMIVCAILGYAVYLLDLTFGYDSTMAGVALGAFCLIILFFKYRLFDLVNMAKEQALNDASGGILVLDKRNRVVYANTVVAKLINGVATVKEILEMPDEKIVRHNARVYQFKKSIIKEHEQVIGLMVEVSDITDSHNYAERLENDVKSRTEEITHIQRSVISGIANIVEARNGETGSHIKRTACYVNLLAEQLREMGYYTTVLTDGYISLMTDAAPLHDLGKIYISDAILMKPGRLTPDEFEIMKSHSAAGVDVIEKVMRGVESDDYVTCAESMAHYHHERWDGNGYPSGLTQDEIPLCARIMSVADVYDALRSERCYKKAMDKDTARQIIKEGSGTQFDPSIVNAFFGCLEKIEAV